MTDQTEDTFPEWLFQRLRSEAPFKSEDAHIEWMALSVEDRLWYEHEAAAVRRAVARNGFKA